MLSRGQAQILTPPVTDICRLRVSDNQFLVIHGHSDLTPLAKVFRH